MKNTKNPPREKKSVDDYKAAKKTIKDAWDKAQAAKLAKKK